MTEDYIASVYEKIHKIEEQAEKRGVDLSRGYPEDSKGWKLQVALDHLAADLNMHFSGTSEENYQRFDRCLEIVELIIGGEFYDKMRKRREKFKERYERCRRLQELLDSL